MGGPDDTAGDSKGEPTGDPRDAWQGQLQSLGQFIRAQRQLAKLTLRQMSELAEVSNPYLSQVERGLHAPSVKVLRSIAGALNLSAETLLSQAGLLVSEQGGTEPGDMEPAATEAAIRLDPMLTGAQKEALLAVYRSYVAANDASPGASRGTGPSS